ncbi:TPA: 3,4-dihydroxy-2-butanone-4-phosphate synthase [Candidatus Micrarchaeota archaeon]|nr:3,4-dihydroxy-2-butanone-4-phosphate synthase [Candidatus Micrarchaeota archaeon]
MALKDTLREVTSDIRKGKLIAIYDGDEREGEADLVFHAGFATPKKIEILRKDAGGLICLAVDKGIAERFALPFFSDIISNSSYELKTMLCKKTAYGDKPAFSVPINHRNVYTGITDNDRSLTIKKFSELAESGEGKQDFCNNFYVPGHIFLLIGSGIENRRGHTELSLELARRAGISGTMVLCEMLGKGKALSKQKVKEYCRKKEITFIEGREIYVRK